MLVELTEKINKMTKEVTNKTQNAVEVVRLQSRISREKDVVESLYKKIGELYFFNCKQDENKLFTKLVKEIADANAEIQNLQDKIHHIKGIQLCAACNEVLKQDMRFCPYCGTEITEEQIEIVEAAEESMEEKNISYSSI